MTLLCALCVWPAAECQAQRGADYTPPTLVLAASTVETDPATQIPQLMLQFTADKADNSVAFEFLFDKSRADSRCGVDFNYGFAANARGTAFPANSQSGPDAAGNGFWSMTINDLPACAAGVTYQYQVTNFNNAIANCGWVRLERPGGVELQTTVLATSLQQVRGARVVPALCVGADLSARAGLAHPQRAGVAHSGVVGDGGHRLHDRHYGHRGPAARVRPRHQRGHPAGAGTRRPAAWHAMTSAAHSPPSAHSQVFEPLSSTASWGLLTSVQGPYQLARKEVGAVPVPAEGVTGPSFTEMTEAAATLLGLPAAPELTGINSDANAHYSGAVTNLAKCVAQGADGSLTTQAIDYADSTGTYAACVQRWFNQATKATCTTEAPDQNLNIAWSVSFDVTCHASFTGSCATTPATNLVTVSWNTYSDNYCPRIIDTEASTAELKVYEKSDFTAEQSQFVFGTKSYFEATATSSIKIEDLETEKITIVSGGANAGQVVYFKENFAVLVDAWWSADSATAAAAGTPAAFLGTFAKNVTGADDLHRKTQWSWTWSAANSAASGDFPTSASVQVDLRIRYTNQNAAAPKRLDVLSVGFHPQLSAASAAASAQTNVGVTARATGAAPAPTSGASSSSAMSAQTIAIGVAVVGGVALVAAGVAVARRRSVVAKSTAANVDTVEMRGVPTATNVV